MHKYGRLMSHGKRVYIRLFFMKFLVAEFKTSLKARKFVYQHGWDYDDDEDYHDGL